MNVSYEYNFREGKFGIFTDNNVYGRAVNYFRELPQTRTQYRNQAFLAGIFKPYGSWVSYRDNQQKMEDYMAMFGLDYGDIKYPSSSLGFGASANFSGSTLNFVSSNLGRLYR